MSILVYEVLYRINNLNRCETGTLVHTGVCFSFFVLSLSPLVWFFLWLPEEVLALLFLLHHENGDFSILMKDILKLSSLKDCRKESSLVCSVQ
jgi:hypothetical protein